MAFVTLLLVACITFFLMNAIPGNPWLSEKTPSEATIQALNAKYGLDQPKYIQLGKYLKNLAQGDFGTSIKMQKNRPVIEIIKEMFPVSAKVGSLALLWAVIVGVPLGCLAAFKRGTWVDSFLRVLCTIGISMPGFVVATLLLHTLCGGIEGVKVFPALFDGKLCTAVCGTWILSDVLSVQTDQNGHARRHQSGIYQDSKSKRSEKQQDHLQTCAS